MKKTIIVLVALIVCGVVYAQDNNAKLLDKLVEKNVITQAEANAIMLEDGTQTIAPVKKDAPNKVRDLFNNRYLQMSGYGMLKYEYDNTNNGANTSKSRHDFRPRVVYLTIAGEVNDQLRYSVLFDFANPKLHELWVEWTAKDFFKLKIGQFKNPLSFENQFAPGTLEYGMFSRPTLHLMGHGKDVIVKQPNRDTPNSIGRDIGIQASGTLIKLKGAKFLDYAVGVFQGSGINAKDPDNTKDFAGMLTMYPVKGLRIGGGAHFGEASYDTGLGVDKHVRNRYVASAEYTYDRLKVRGEYMRGKDSETTLDGAYGMVMYSLLPKKQLDILAKVSYYDGNKDAHKEVMDYTFGLNYNIFKMTRVQLNYTYSDYTKVWGIDDNHNVLVQFQVGF